MHLPRHLPTSRPGIQRKSECVGWRLTRSKLGQGVPPRELWVFCAPAELSIRPPWLQTPGPLLATLMSFLCLPSISLPLLHPQKTVSVAETERPPERQKNKEQLKTGYVCDAHSPVKVSFSRTGCSERSWPTSRALPLLLTQGQGSPFYKGSPSHLASPTSPRPSWTTQGWPRVGHTLSHDSLCGLSNSPLLIFHDKV